MGKVVHHSGISLCTLLTVLFVALKLCKVIQWSWLWVLSPLWLPWALAFVVMGAIGLAAVAIKVIDRLLNKKHDA